MVGTTYLLLALAAGAAWGGTNALDDRVVDAWDGRMLPVAGAAGLSRVVAIPAFALAGLLPIPSLRAVAGSAAIGVVSFVGIGLYYHAVDAGDAVQYAVVSETGPLFVLVAAVVVLGEQLSGGEVGGIVLLVGGAALLTVQRRGVGVELRPEAAVLLVTTVLFAAVSVLAEVVVDSFQSSLALVGWLWVGVCCTAAVAVAADVIPRGETVATLRTPGVGLPLLAGLGTETLGYAAYFGALAAGPVAIASALSSVRPFFALAWVVVLRQSIPDARALGRRAVALRLVAGGLVVLGVWLVQ